MNKPDVLSERKLRQLHSFEPPDECMACLNLTCEAQRDDTWQKAQAIHEAEIESLHVAYTKLADDKVKATKEFYLEKIRQAKAEERARLKEEIEKSRVKDGEIVAQVLNKSRRADTSSHSGFLICKAVAQARLDNTLKILEGKC